MTANNDDLAELAANVERAAAGTFPGRRLAGLTVLPGGHSGLTHVAAFPGSGDDVRVVVKSAPPGRPARGRHDVLRQAKILRALNAWGQISVPEVLFWADAPVPLFGMGMVEGFAAEPVMEEPRSGERPDLVATAWRAAVDLLAAMQRATPDDLGLQDEPIVSPAQELKRWTATMRSAGLEADDRATELVRRLETGAPGTSGPCLVHGDYRLGNMLQRGGAIEALVDWEIWTLGDPRSDLGWLTIFTDATNFPGLGRPAPGTPTADEVVRRYLEATGRGTEGVAWFRALACFKYAAIMAHNLRRHREGRHHDPHQERLVESTSALLERGLALLDER